MARRFSVFIAGVAQAAVQAADPRVMAPKKLTTAQHTVHKAQRPAFGTESPIQVSTPPVLIIGASRRHQGGFHLGDR